jgi:hypothetical protein
MPNVKAQSSNKYQITKFKVEVSFDIWILAFEIDERLLQQFTLGHNKIP